MDGRKLSRKGQEVSRAGLAEVFGVALTTVDTWIRTGCPCVSRGSRGVQAKFNTADVSQWLRDKARQEGSGTSLADETELKRRKLAAEAERAELELAKEKGEVAPVREFERAQAAAMAAIRANMRNVPGRAVLQLLGCTDELEFKNTLMDEIDLALVTAAEAELDLGEDEDDEDEAAE